MKNLVMYENPTVYDNIMKYLSSKGIDFDNLSIDKKITVINKLERSCKSCDLHYETKYQNIPSRLNKDSMFLFIGRNPNGTEAQNNSLYPENTRQGNIFKKYLSLLGIGEGEISVLNMCQCHGRNNRPVTSEEIGKCVAFKKMELQCLPNIKMIFAMGQDSLKWLYGISHPGAMQCTGDVYESELNGRKVYVCCVLHPSQVLIDLSLGKETGMVLRQMSELVKKVREE